MAEQRQHTRISKSLVISYRPANQFLGSGGRSKNISGGGICLPLVQKLEPHVILKIGFSFSNDDKPMEAMGEVVWVKKREDTQFPFEAGIKFINIKPADRDKILDVVSKEANSEVKWLD